MGLELTQQASASQRVEDASAGDIGLVKWDGADVVVLRTDEDEWPLVALDDGVLLPRSMLEADFKPLPAGSTFEST